MRERGYVKMEERYKGHRSKVIQTNVGMEM